jgi:hypothetical protein
MRQDRTNKHKHKYKTQHQTRNDIQIVASRGKIRKTNQGKTAHTCNTHRSIKRDKWLPGFLSLDFPGLGMRCSRGIYDKPLLHRCKHRHTALNDPVFIFHQSNYFPFKHQTQYCQNLEQVQRCAVVRTH